MVVAKKNVLTHKNGVGASGGGGDMAGGVEHRRSQSKCK